MSYRQDLENEIYDFRKFSLFYMSYNLQLTYHKCGPYNEWNLR